MRITFNMMSMKHNSSISSSLANMLAAGDRVNAQQDLLKPEQNASGYVSAYNVQRTIDELNQFKENGESATGWISNSETILTDALDKLKKVKADFAIGGANATNDADARAAMAKEVATIMEDLMGYANSTYLGRHIFGGFQTETPPFSGSGSSISNVSSSILGADSIDNIPVFSDLGELASGAYRTKISVVNGIATVSVLDSNGKPVVLDSNGSDEANKKGNATSDTLSFKYEPGKVVNTGLGFSIQMPDKEITNADITVGFNYKAGSEVSYAGDMGSILSQIGYDQNIAKNIPGSDIFMQSFKTLLSTKVLTSNGSLANLATLLSELDGNNFATGDSMNISGTDSHGRPVGAATIVSPINPTLNHTNTTDEERTLKVAYGNKMYQVVIPKGDYKSADKLAEAVQEQLKTAEYIGSVNVPADGYDELNDFKNSIEQQIDSGYFTPATGDEKKKTVDLSKDISVTADGDRLSFYTSKAGDNVQLAISGSEGSDLGFTDSVTVAEGKDTQFDFGTTYNNNGIENISTEHSNMDFSAGGKFDFFINGKPVSVNLPARGPVTTTDVSATTVYDGTTDFNITINGKNIKVPAAELNGKTVADQEKIINQKLIDSGFGGSNSISLTAPVAPATTYTVDLNSATAPTKKDIEFELQSALNSAGFTGDISASLNSVNSSDPNDLGKFDLSFAVVNNNINDSTQINTVYFDKNAVPPYKDMQTDIPTIKQTPGQNNTTMGDYMKFLNNLYGETATVSLVEGKIQVKDKRSGENSELTFFQNSTESGLQSTTDNDLVIGGKYRGQGDVTWGIDMTNSVSTDGTRTVHISIKDVNGLEVYNQKVDNYLGGEITLPSGVTITPNENQFPTPPETSLTTSFNLDLIDDTKASLGIMKVTDNGSNDNMFRVLTNLENALKYNIDSTENGIGAFGAWGNASLGSTATPSFDGTYKGNYNDSWKYEIMQNGSQDDFYIQNESYSTSGKTAFDQNLINDLGGEISFGVNMYDNVTGKSSTINLDIDLSKAFPPLTDAASTNAYIVKELNNNPELKKQGITYASDSDGKIVMESNSGTKIVSFAENLGALPANANKNVLSNFIMGFQPLDNKPLPETSYPLTLTDTDFYVTDIGDPADPSKKITLPAPATYATKEELLDAINTELAVSTVGRVEASFSEKTGALVFKNADNTATEVYGNNELGISTSDTGTVIAAKASGMPNPALSETSDEDRTFTFNYIDNLGVQRSKSIMLDKKDYDSPTALVEEINRLIALDPDLVGLDAKLDSDGKSNDKGKIVFTTDPATMNSLSVENGYSGILGFPKAGDQTTVRVTSAENGNVVQEITLDTANDSTYVADGVYIRFDSGKINATDFFNVGVGTGISEQIDYLDQIEKQLLEAVANVGGRLSRVESVTNFHTTVIASSETTKSTYLGSTPQDIAAAMTDQALAKSAYETALRITSSIFDISLLDFLR